MSVSIIIKCHKLKTEYWLIPLKQLKVRLNQNFIDNSENTIIPCLILWNSLFIKCPWQVHCASKAVQQDNRKLLHLKISLFNSFIYSPTYLLQFEKSTSIEDDLQYIWFFSSQACCTTLYLVDQYFDFFIEKTGKLLLTILECLFLKKLGSKSRCTRTEHKSW